MASEITQDVLDNGIVLAFTDLGSGGGGWWSLPLVLPASENLTMVVQYAYLVGGVVIQLTNSIDASVAFAVDGFGVKVIVLPAGANKVGIDLTNYEAVARYSGL